MKFIVRWTKAILCASSRPPIEWSDPNSNSSWTGEQTRARRMDINRAHYNASWYQHSHSGCGCKFEVEYE